MLLAEPVPAVVLRTCFQSGFSTTLSCVHMFRVAGEGGKLCLHYRRDVLTIHPTARGLRCPVQPCGRLHSVHFDAQKEMGGGIPLDPSTWMIRGPGTLSILLSSLSLQCRHIGSCEWFCLCSPVPATLI